MASHHGNVRAISSESEYTSVLGSNAGKLIVVDFTAKWCGPCRMVAPIFVSLSIKYPNVVFLKVDVDECSDIAQSAGVRAMPTFQFLKDGRKVDEFSGADANKLEAVIEKHMTQAQESFGGSGHRLGGGSGGSSLAERYGAQTTGGPARPPAPAPAAAPAVEEDVDLQEAIRMSLVETGSSGGPTTDEAPKESEAAAPAATTATGTPDAAAETAAGDEESVLPVNHDMLKTLIGMDFSKVRAEKGLLATGSKSTEAAMEWIFEHMEDPDIDEPWVSVASGSSNLSPEERKAKLEEAIKRAREKKDKAEAEAEIEREKARRVAGKAAIEEARKLEDQKRQRDIDERKREKREELDHRNRLRAMLQQDKLERQAKMAALKGQTAAAAPVAVQQAPKPAANGPAKEYTECNLQVKLTDGSAIRGSFKPTDTLRVVYDHVVKSRTDAHGPFQLVNVSAFPRKIYPDAMLDATTLADAGLVPSGSLLVTK